MIKTNETKTNVGRNKKQLSIVLQKTLNKHAYRN